MERNCTLLIHHDKGVPPTKDDLRKEIESKDEKAKIRALKTLILLLLNGESMPKLLMTVIRYCVTTMNHELKKLMFLYWEVVNKYGEDGKLLPEMILVCNALLQDIKHPNHFIRGCTLRFLCRIKELEIIQPLIPAIEENLTHGDPFVRKYAVMAIYMIQRHFGEDCIPDAPDIIENFLNSETDSSARRNAFLMLYRCAQDKAVSFFVSNVDKVLKYGDGFQLIILELTRKVCKEDPSQKSRFIKVIFQLLQSTSSAVSFEAAWTLVSLSAAPTAVRAAAQTYTHLLSSESDNNVKLIVLDKLLGLRKYHGKILQELLMDILRVLSSPNSDIRRKTLDLAMELVSPRNINEVVLILKKEVIKTQSKELDRGEAAEYREMLVKAIHKCAVKFPQVADSVVHLLMDFLSGEGAIDVVLFVREIIETYPHLRETVLNKLIECFPDIKEANVYRVALWILGEYATEANSREAVMDVIYECLGPVPFTIKKIETEEKDEESKIDVPAMIASSKVTVLPDGTYATQTALTSQAAEQIVDSSDPLLRQKILGGNYLLAATVVSSLTKLILREGEKKGMDNEQVKGLSVKFLLMCCSLIQVGKHAPAASRIDQDSYDRISICMRAILDPAVAQQVKKIVLEECRGVLKTMLATRRRLVASDQNELEASILIQPDDVISFRQLKSRRGLGATDVELDDEGDLNKAAGISKTMDFSTQLAHVHQLTGFSDPVYAEAQVTVHDYDILLDILVINRTSNTLTNLAVELSTMGDLKLVERPQNFTLGPKDFKRIKANIKVSSTETGQIFGTIVYDSPNSVETTYINLNDIHCDIMDYIKPATCSDADFRSMWSEFEWENKVAVNTSIADVNEFLEHIVESTNMKCLTPFSSLGGDCNFLAANLYAKSIFGEDALVNVSIEKVQEKVEGYIRIRAKTQGIALSLGDRITLKQKEKTPAKLGILQ